MVHAKLQAVLYAAAVLLLISTAVAIDAIALLRVIVHAASARSSSPARHTLVALSPEASRVLLSQMIFSVSDSFHVWRCN
jgi:hypothetical protein